MNRDRAILVATRLAIAVAVLGTAWARGDDSQAAPETSREAQQLVHQSLSSEMTGDNDRRDQLLVRALVTEPNSAAAHWHTGRLREDGQWRSIAEVQRRAAHDEQLTEYRQLRGRLQGDPRGMLVLARWCDREGLKELADLHFRQLLTHATADGTIREEATRKLGLREFGGELLTEQEIQQRRDVADRIQEAMKHWRPQLISWRKAIESDSEKRRDYAIQQMNEVDDRYVIPVLETFVSSSGPQFGQQIVALLGRFSEHEATESLVRFALFAPESSVHDGAVAELKKRPLHDYAPMLLSGLVSPIQSQWRVFTDVNGNLRYQHVLYRDGQQANQLLATDHVTVTSDRIVASEFRGREQASEEVNRSPADLSMGLSFQGNRPLASADEMKTQAHIAVASAVASAAERERNVAAANSRIQDSNERIYLTLEQVSGAALPRNPADWWYWWDEYNETHKLRPTEVAYLPTMDVLERPLMAQYDYQAYSTRPNRGYSCFAPGTPVWTECGVVPIERVQAGDRVLSQDPDSGELALKLVEQVTAGPATSSLSEITIEGRTIYPTLGHVMWVNGQGWRIAKRLTPGHFVHGLTGAMAVDAIRWLPAPPVVHNLIVDDFHTYFVGEKGILVHDITYHRPTRTLVPGLLEETTPTRRGGPDRQLEGTLADGFR